MSQSQAFVLVGGVSHTAAFFEVLIKELEHHGHQSHAVSYPTVGCDTAGTTQQDEVKAIQDAIAHFVDDEQKDVILVMHSYGGWPGSRAVKGFDKETRIKEGKQHGIIELVFLAAFLLPDNAPMAQFSYLPHWLTNENGERIPNKHSIPLLFSDLDPIAQQHWFSRFEPQRNDFTAETVPDAPWHLSVPKTYIITTGDKTATIQFQLTMLQAVMDDTWSIKTIKAGHEPFLSQPVNLAKVLLQPTY
ncbi:Alpha/beta hydrolase fold-1 [Talaromyces proteolyticus]|uniref:Alpha/beta hydrolase fold-1 n=1 Tax=Talaromyces proteolyticus TaxID=1131652 RepID=A0AAD4KSH1_9EURO|nr:Alpha/beta hydrolase fold-1 [Talaromyces proteolyticus]KAH8695015.1 Alpha/beta hydrolase fold-1 [Talaromyces proteolyticus]